MTLVIIPVLWDFSHRRRGQLVQKQIFLFLLSQVGKCIATKAALSSGEKEKARQLTGGGGFREGGLVGRAAGKWGRLHALGDKQASTGAGWKLGEGAGTPVGTGVHRH